jgi:transcriptional regulator with XRE-family HTH domain
VPLDSQPDWIIESRRATGERIRLARLSANLTQDRLVELTGIPRLTVQRIEAGATDARLSWLLLTARALDIPLADLVRDGE